MAMNKHEYDYVNLVERFGEDKIKSRLSSIDECMSVFIKSMGYEEKCRISTGVLYQAIIDYMLAKNSNGIFFINYIKIHAYTSYWLLRRKPIQIVKDDDMDSELAFVNENFVAFYLFTFLLGDDSRVVIRRDKLQEYNEFTENIKYVLRYRAVTAQMIETILESYNAGRIFELSKQ